MILKSKFSTDVKEVKLGFSWTTLFFGVAVPMFRGDWKWAIITFLAALLTGGITWFAVPFFYNKLYVKELLAKGYHPTSLDDLNRLADCGLVNMLQYEILKELLVGEEN